MKKTLLIILAIIVIGGAVYFGLRSQKAAPQGASVFTTASSTETGVLDQTYADPDGRFSFKHPSSYDVRKIAGEEGEEYVIADKKGTGLGFQIRIQEADEEIDITEPLIKRDLPDLNIKNPQQVQLGDSRQGLAFESDSAIFGGASREIWFVYKGYFYQVSGYMAVDNDLQAIMNTWTFL